jgi:hypothetical protein
MAVGPNDLTTLTNTLNWLGLQADDAGGTVQRVITAVSAMIQGQIGRTIVAAFYTEILDGRGRQRIMLPNAPIISVSSVTLIIGSSGTLVIPSRATGVTGYTFSDKFVYLDPPYRFDRGAQNVQIVYQGGYITVPLDLEQACLTWIKTIMDGQNYSAALAKAKAGQTALDFSYVMTKLHGYTVPMPPAVFTALAPYRRVTPSW